MSAAGDLRSRAATGQATGAVCGGVLPAIALHGCRCSALAIEEICTGALIKVEADHIC